MTTATKQGHTPGPKHSPERLAQWRKFGAKRRAKPGFREKARAIEKRYEEKVKRDPVKKARRAELMRSYRADPQLKVKHRAREELNRAVKCGRVNKSPCLGCKNPEVEGHHEDYSRPLDVIWLCKKCHTAMHRARATGQGGGE